MKTITSILTFYYFKEKVQCILQNLLAIDNYAVLFSSHREETTIILLFSVLLLLSVVYFASLIAVTATTNEGLEKINEDVTTEWDLRSKQKEENKPPGHDIRFAEIPRYSALGQSLNLNPSYKTASVLIIFAITDPSGIILTSFLNPHHRAATIKVDGVITHCRIVDLFSPGFTPSVRRISIGRHVPARFGGILMPCGVPCQHPLLTRQVPMLIYDDGKGLLEAELRTTSPILSNLSGANTTQGGIPNYTQGSSSGTS